MKARVPKQPGMGNMQQMIKQAQQMQEKMEEVQEELNEREFEGIAGGNAVKATVNGKKELVGVTLDPEVVDPDDIEMLEDLIVAAVNDGLRRVQETTDAEMEKVTGGSGMPGIL